MIQRALRNSRLAAGLAALALAAPPLGAHDAAQGIAQGEMIEVKVTTAEGRDAGMVTFRQAEQGVLITANIKNLTTGAHGFHIHETGACAPDFGAAGGHFNPADKEHGFDNENGYHVGDLPNLVVGADGTAYTEFFVPQVSLTGGPSDRLPYTLADEDGSSIMIHAKPDDYKDMASAGDRLACGVIVKPRH
ncbi:MAG: superoxide dismutase family protein [Erythrobacter sp.]